MCPIVPLIWPLCWALSAISPLNRTKNRIGRSINHNSRHGGSSLFYVYSWIQLKSADSTGFCRSHIKTVITNRKYFWKRPGQGTISRYLNPVWHSDWTTELTVTFTEHCTNVYIITAPLYVYIPTTCTVHRINIAWSCQLNVSFTGRNN